MWIFLHVPHTGSELERPPMKPPMQWAWSPAVISIGSHSGGSKVTWCVFCTGSRHWGLWSRVSGRSSCRRRCVCVCVCVDSTHLILSHLFRDRGRAHRNLTPAAGRRARHMQLLRINDANDTRLHTLTHTHTHTHTHTLLHTWLACQHTHCVREKIQKHTWVHRCECYLSIYLSIYLSVYHCILVIKPLKVAIGFHSMEKNYGSQRLPSTSTTITFGQTIPLSDFL